MMASEMDLGEVVVASGVDDAVAAGVESALRMANNVVVEAKSLGGRINKAVGNVVDGTLKKVRC